MEMEYSQRLEKIEALLDAALPRAPDAAWLEETFPGLGVAPRPETALPLTAPGRDLLDRGGKRWRPLLSLLVCEASGGGEAVLPLLPLVEFPHNASLIHDDIEDNSAERRGKPALHLLYGTDAALNSGSFLYFLPLARLETWDAPPEARSRVWTLWARHLRRLHLGQSLDIAWHRDFLSLPSVEDYFLMCRLKTGCLARFAAMLGVEAAFSKEGGSLPPASSPAGFRPPPQRGEFDPLSAPQRPASTETADYYGHAAETLGVGFQILDDVKNLTTGVAGKKRGDDIVEGKKSLPVLLYLHAHPEKAEFTAKCFAAAREGGVSVPETGALIAELEQAGALDEARKRGEALISEAKEAFAAPPPLTEQTGLTSQTSLPEAAKARGLLAGLAELLR